MVTLRMMRFRLIKGGCLMAVFCGLGTLYLPVAGQQTNPALLSSASPHSTASIYHTGPSETITSFGFRQFSGGVIILRATLNGMPDSLNFILDTGCGGISLDSATCQRLNIPLTPSDVVIRGIAGVRKVDFARNNTLHLPGLSIPSLNFHINDYSILSNVYGQHIDGIIGYTFFNQYIIKINYDTRRIEVCTPGDITYPRGGFLLKTAGSTIPIERAQLTEDRSFFSRFYLDIGAGLCLMLSKEFTEDSIWFKSRKPFRTAPVEGIGGKTDMDLTTIRKFQIGPYRFKKVPVYILDDVYGVTQYPQLGGLIGNDLMRRFNTIFNYRKKEIYLLPNKHFRERFDYSYTGLGFYYLDGQVRITDIVPSSPADKAGLKPGDVVLGMDNFIGKDIQEYKTILLQTGKTVQVLIMREGRLRSVSLKIGNILRRQKK